MRRLPFASVMLLGLAAGAAAQAADSPLAELDEDLRRLGARAAPAVVRVVANRAVVVDTSRAGDVWTYIAPVDTTTGSGFVVAKDRVVTSRHVVAGARDLSVELADGRRVPARLAGSDDFYAVALLEADTGEIAPLAPEAGVRPTTGGLAVLFGNAVDGGGAPVLAMTGGVRRARGNFDNYFVVSAPLLPGGSGGPVLSAGGDLIGLAHSSFGERSGGSERGTASPRVSYCVPAPDLRHAIAQLEEHGRVRRAWLGVTLSGSDTRVASVVEGGPAAGAGVRAGDRLMELGNTPTPHERALVRALARQGPGTAVPLVVERGGAEKRLRVTLGERPVPSRENAFELLDGQGIRLTRVASLSPIRWLRLRENDVIATIDGRAVSGEEQVRQALARMEELRPVRVEVLRREPDAGDGEVRRVSIVFGGKFTLAAQPAPAPAPDPAEGD